MKKLLLLLLSAFLFCSCEIGLGDSIYNCSVCNTVYNTKEEALNCRHTRYCPGASQEEIRDKENTIIKKEEEIVKKDEVITEQKEIITQLSDALGSNLNFTSSGFTDKKEVYPDPYLGRAWEELWDNKHGQTEKDGKIYKGRQVGTKGVGYRGYSYFNYTNKLTVGSKNIVFRLTYDESFEDWSQTSSEEIRTIYDNDKVFQIYTGIVCLKPEEKIWVMKLVDMMDMNNSYYTLMKETGVNEFSTYGHYDVLTDCINADISGATWQKIDFSDLMVAE